MKKLFVIAAIALATLPMAAQDHCAMAFLSAQKAIFRC